MREVLVVYNLDKMNSVSESSRMDDFKSEKKNNAITNQSVLMNPITKGKKNPNLTCCMLSENKDTNSKQHGFIRSNP